MRRHAFLGLILLVQICMAADLEQLLRAYRANPSDWKLAHESLGGCAFQKLGNGTQNNDYENQPYVAKRSRQFSLSAKGRYLASLLRRGNYGLFSGTLKLGLQSAIMGKFGERPKGRR